MSKIKQISAREILDSRGNPTIEATVILEDSAVGVAACPSGASVGTYEAVELRDHDDKRFHGQGVLKAIDNVKSIIAPALIGIDATKQSEIDKKMIDLDGTPNKGKLGANAILSVSMAVSKAAAKSLGMSLYSYLRQYFKSANTFKIPTPLFNLINGGKHAGENLNFQEHLIIPASSKTYTESLQLGVGLHQKLKTILKDRNSPILVGDEGGFGPNLGTNKDALLLLKQAVEQSPYRFGFDVFLGLDAAASNFYHNKQYKIKDKSLPLSSDDLINYYAELNQEFNLLYLEDPLAEDDWEGWQKLLARISQNTIIVGDDLTVTNPFRLQTAIDKKAITGIIIKPNQIGTVIETMAVVEVTKQAGIKIIISHRSGETNDDFIADFAVAAGADYVKFGAPVRGERVAKYNRLLQIENNIKNAKNTTEI